MRRIMPKRLISMYLNIWSGSSIYRGWGAVQLAFQFVHEAVGGDVAPNERIFRVPLTSEAPSSFMTCVVSLRFRVLLRYTQMWISTSIWVANSGQLWQLRPKWYLTGSGGSWPFNIWAWSGGSEWAYFSGWAICPRRSIFFPTGVEVMYTMTQKIKITNIFFMDLNFEAFTC